MGREMLAIAIKNSMILALVIMIAHFLLKSSGEDRMFTTPPAGPTADLPSQPRKEEREVVAAASADDLYSYVYGEPEGSVTSEVSSAMGTSMMQAPPSPVPMSTPMTSKTQDNDMLAGYEASLSDQWCVL